MHLYTISIIIATSNEVSVIIIVSRTRAHVTKMWRSPEKLAACTENFPVVLANNHADWDSFETNILEKQTFISSNDFGEEQTEEQDIKCARYEPLQSTYYLETYQDTRKNSVIRANKESDQEQFNDLRIHIKRECDARGEEHVFQNSLCEFSNAKENYVNHTQHDGLDANENRDSNFATSPTENSKQELMFLMMMEARQQMRVDENDCNGDNLDRRAAGVFECKVCDTTWKKESVFKRHLEEHMSTNTFECHQCSTSFPNKEQLERHISTHMIVVHFTCNICDFNTR